jgi:ketosteroid isomerase-like protein
VSSAIVEGLRANIEAFNHTGTLDPEILAPDFELHQASSIIDTAGVFRGKDAMRRSLSELEQSFEDLRFEAERFIEAPSGEVVVFIRAQGRGRGSGVEIDNEIAWVFTFREGKTARLTIYEERSEALEALGLPA